MMNWPHTRDAEPSLRLKLSFTYVSLYHVTVLGGDSTGAPCLGTSKSSELTCLLCDPVMPYLVVRPRHLEMRVRPKTCA